MSRRNFTTITAESGAKKNFGFHGYMCKHVHLEHVWIYVLHLFGYIFISHFSLAHHYLCTGESFSSILDTF
ncbi:unnamed protein product [Brassica oleracea]